MASNQVVVAKNWIFMEKTALIRGAWMEQLELGPLRYQPRSGSSEKEPQRALEVWDG